MEAFHSFWSEPGRARNGGEIRFPDYEQLTAILSALAWQRHSGRVRMVTDTEGAAFFDSIGVSRIWNEVSVSLDELKGNADPFLFWAAGKLHALQSMPVPCVMLDTDLIVWKNVEHLLDADVTAAHPEEITESVYPDPSGFRLKPGYAFPVGWDFSLHAANTAFLCIKNMEFRNYYTEAALTFLQNVEPDGLNPVTAMCFAEQRLLPVCAKETGQSLGFLMDTPESGGQDFLTHNWGFKQVLDRLPRAREEFCMRCVRRIAEDFPERAELLLGCRDLSEYYLRYLRKH